ncbi:MAG: hypothetical protein ING24_13160 [Roseomonas sp.]|jgi:hypothetical protein|nr:hypothetical protein [Roseomonas sp.]MCA3343376.1 hypothetical protein [Roseomonas sp.]
MTEPIVSSSAFIDASVIAACFSAIATALAAIATWRGPIEAARLAEELRQTAAAEEEKNRLKIQVFNSLMAHRAAFWVEESVRNLNLIDVVFHDSRAVRDAWADLFASFDKTKNFPEHVTNERFHKLLSVMASDLGLSKSLLPDDLRRIYYPEMLAETALLEQLERKNRLEKLAGGSRPTANSAPISSSNDYWPPRP